MIKVYSIIMQTANNKLVIIMVGLPARGKTFSAAKLERYLNWQGERVKTFNVGAYRRKFLGKESSRSDFFNSDNQFLNKKREVIAKKLFANLLNWLQSKGQIAIYDATNVSSGRQKYLKDECQKKHFNFIFIECICNKKDILDRVINVKLKNNFDYKNRKKDKAKKDFLERVAHYKKVYQTVENELPYIKIFNFGERVKKNFNINNDQLNDIFLFLQSLSLIEKNIYLIRHTESVFNRENRIGGDAPLTDKGSKDAQEIANNFKDKKMIIFTSSKKRTKETASFFPQQKRRLKELDEINSGICNDMTYKKIALKYPEIFKARAKNKFNYRYPEGESYKDLIERTKPAVIKIEAQKSDVLIIAHRAVNRCLLSYFIPVSSHNIPYIKMPLLKIIKIYSDDYRYKYKIIKI